MTLKLSQTYKIVSQFSLYFFPFLLRTLIHKLFFRGLFLAMNFSRFCSSISFRHT